MFPQAELKYVTLLSLSFWRYLSELISHLKGVGIERTDFSLWVGMISIPVPFLFLIKKKKFKNFESNYDVVKRSE